MAVATKLEVVQQWLDQTSELNRVQASSTEGKPITPSEILEIAASCEWANLEDVSDLLYSKQGVMYSVCLELGWGNPSDAYRHGNSDRAGVFFFNAYHSSN